MPIMDSTLLFSEDQDLSSLSTGDTTSTNVVYIPQVTNHKGTSVNDRPFVGGRNYLNVVATTGLSSAVAGDLDIEVYAHTSASGVTTSGDLVFQYKVETVDTNGSNYPNGSVLVSQSFPIEQMKPYLEIKYNATNSLDLNAGEVTAYIGDPVGTDHGA